ncbi:hypothetical protein CAEBREN_06161 [Caenorhabditis brenneri]|uniref:Uncharacterized protein n=1 Tax=Caenorhabditis brenneri TaxID=135651 RepID=G0MMY4_CAEBE|nr:hypothetical protein CAEBREN_06161 [Caenorhabditis brenneri]
MGIKFVQMCEPLNLAWFKSKLDFPHSSFVAATSSRATAEINGKCKEMEDDCFWGKAMLKKTRKLGRQTKYTGIAGMLAPLNVHVPSDSEDEEERCGGSHELWNLGSGKICESKNREILYRFMDQGAR